MVCVMAAFNYKTALIPHEVGKMGSCKLYSVFFIHIIMVGFFFSKKEKYYSSVFSGVFKNLLLTEHFLASREDGCIDLSQQLPFKPMNISSSLLLLCRIALYFHVSHIAIIMSGEWRWMVC